MKTPKTTGKKQDGRFKPGLSGNPAGRPKGSRHKYIMAALVLLEGEAEKLTRAAIDEALSGNFAALKLCIDRILPVAKERPIAVSFPKVTDASDLSQMTGTLLSAVGSGDLGPNQAAALAKVIDTHRNTLELTEIESRLIKLEEGLNDEERN